MLKMTITIDHKISLKIQQKLPLYLSPSPSAVYVCVSNSLTVSPSPYPLHMCVPLTLSSSPDPQSFYLNLNNEMVHSSTIQ